jgi:arginyl-tRNA synthetase
LIPIFARILNARGDGSAAGNQEDCWQLLLAASKAGSAIERAVASGEPSHVARYAFQLAQAFSNFYHEFPVLSETDPERKRSCCG